jgi:hypothetical protein
VKYDIKPLHHCMTATHLQQVCSRKTLSRNKHTKETTKQLNATGGWVG